MFVQIFLGSTYLKQSQTKFTTTTTTTTTEILGIYYLILQFSTKNRKKYFDWIKNLIV